MNKLNADLYSVHLFLRSYEAISSYLFKNLHTKKDSIITVCHLIYFFPNGNKQDTDKVFKKTKKNESVIATSNNTVQTALERWNAAH